MAIPTVIAGLKRLASDADDIDAGYERDFGPVPDDVKALDHAVSLAERAVAGASGIDDVIEALRGFNSTQSVIQSDRIRLLHASRDFRDAVTKFKRVLAPLR